MKQSILITNIKQLLQVNRTGIVKGNELKQLPLLENAWLLLENSLIKDFGIQEESENEILKKHGTPLTTLINAAGCIVMPAFCDSHTHLVYAGTREQEFVDRINGLSYEEIAARGGGILNSANLLRKAGEEELFDSAWQRLEEIKRLGTGAVEIKSGYGLSLESELKMLRVIQQLKNKSPLTIKATFLGAHAIPSEFKNNKRGYLDLIIHEMMPAIAAEKLADFCDIFCERNYFTSEDTIEILEAGWKYGLKPKVHAEQLSNSGGVLAGIQCNAISVDHLEYVGDNEIEALKNSQTMSTLLPGAAFFLSLPHPPARKIIDAGLPVAIASDYNPGSSPSGNMQFNMSVACIQYRMTPEETINATTINGAYAMDVIDTLGSISKGKKANIIITKPISTFNFIPYSFANNLIETVILNGEIVAR